MSGAVEPSAQGLVATDHYRSDDFPPVGYLNDWTVRPGDRVEVFVSSSAEHVAAQVVRLTYRPDGEGRPQLVEEAVTTDLPATVTGAVQPIKLGSWLDVDRALPFDRGVTFGCWFQPTLQDGARSTIVSLSDAGPGGSRRNGYCAALDGHGGLSVTHQGPSGSTTATLDARLTTRQWYRLRFTHDFATGQLTLELWDSDATVTGGADAQPAATTSVDTAPVNTQSRLYLRLAADHTVDGPADHFDGKISEPWVHGQSLPAIDARLGGQGSLAPLARWDLSIGLDRQVVTDVGEHGYHGRVFNRPVRGVTGRTWDGSVQHPHDDPRQYDAIKFNRDDVDNVGWSPVAGFSVPTDLASGVYAVRLHDGVRANHLPFFVVGTPDQPDQRPVAVVMPTFTYLAYADEHVFERPQAHQWIKDVHGIEHVAYPVDVFDAYILANGLSGLYDLHPDGSGVHVSSRRRPIVNVRPDAQMRHLATGEGSPHGFGQDLYLLAWLEHEGFAFDVLTDEAVHHGGAELLANYRTVVFASHPEYVSEQMLDATAGYIDGGGRVMYLGGNGFYWVVSLDPHTGDAIELRRWAGTQGWAADPGERHHAMTGEVGGTWRGRGRAPQQTVGVGFCAQGFDVNTVYHRAEASYQPDVAWVFDGVEGPVVGDEPNLVNRHGAAGFEVDQADVALGTHPDTVILASATEFTRAYVPSDEDLAEAAADPNRDVADVAPRSDLVLRINEAGGGYFSVGSIAWTGALWSRNADGDVARITRNVLRRFAAVDSFAAIDSAGGSR